MRDIFADLASPLSDPDPVRRAQIQMKQPLPKRFYDEVTVSESDDGFHILLDGKPVRTPLKNTLALPTARAAELVAEEWRAQKDVIDPSTMPMTRLANTALDGVANETDAVFAEITRYAGSDLLCYRADGPENLVSNQAKIWDPIVYWASEKLGARFILIEGIMHRQQPEEALVALERALAEFRAPLQLASLFTVTALTGSAILAAAFAHGAISAEEAWTAAHVDEDWNITLWGMDEEAAARREKRWQEMQAAASLFNATRP